MDNRPFDRDKWEMMKNLFADQNRHLAEELPECRTDDMCFVMDWFDNGMHLCGIGPSFIDPDATVRLTLNIKPGLFVLCSDVAVLRTVMTIYKYNEINVYDNIEYECNNFTVTDIMLKPHLSKPGVLCKIVTPTVRDSLDLHRKLSKNNDCQYKFAAVSNYWSASRQIMFELICKRKAGDPDNYNVPKTVNRWFDSEFQPKIQQAPQIPLITFDIETVSNDRYRLPTGEAVHDKLFSVSVHHVDNNRLFSLVYLPLDGVSVKDLKDQMLSLDEYPDYKGQENVVEVFTNEFDILKRTVDLLSWPVRNTKCFFYNKRKPMHYLFGYNSMNYDLKYLFLRSAFFNFKNIPVSQFVYNHGFCLGLEQMHIDLYFVARMRYQLPKYSLNYLSEVILKDKKVDVNSVAIRWTFDHLRNTQKLWPHTDEHMKANRLPSLRDMIHYNNSDTLLVSELIAKTSAVTYVREYGHNARISASSINSNYNKIRFRLLSQCEVVALEYKKFLTTFKSSRQSLVLPVAETDICDINTCYTPIDYGVVERDNQDKLSTKGRYPGGVTYCFGEFDVPRVQEYDYRIAYPLLMDRLNISDETLSIVRASDLKIMYPCIVNKTSYRVFDYLTHSSDESKSASRVYLHNCIYNGSYCGGEFDFTTEELHKRRNRKVIIVYCKNTTFTGVLSTIIQSFNEKREHAKRLWSTLASNLESLRTSELYYRNKLLERTYTTNEAVPVPEDTASNCEFTSDNEDCDVQPLESSDDDDDELPGSTYDLQPLVSSDDDAESVQPFESSDDELDTNDDDDIQPIEASDNDDDDFILDPQLPAIVEKFEPQFNFKNCEWLRETENHTIQVNIPKLGEVSLERLIEIYKETIKILQIEHDAMHSLYLTLKPIVASIYGVIGAGKPEMAAAITCIIRTTLLTEPYRLLLRHRFHTSGMRCKR